MSARRWSEAQVRELAERLTPTEAAVLATLANLRLATGGQLTRLHFATRPSAADQARRLLRRMVELRLLTRLDRTIGGIRAGSQAYVYALDVVGQRLTSPKRPRRPSTPGRTFLAHSLAVSEWYVRLSEAARSGRLDLLEFTGEPGCWRSFNGPGGGRLTLKPDAFVRLGLGPFEDRWFLEVDRATEGSRALSAKATLYRRYWQSGLELALGPVFPRTLWIVPSEARKAVLVDVLAAQPSEAWPLFQIATEANALAVLTGGQP